MNLSNVPDTLEGMTIEQLAELAWQARQVEEELKALKSMVDEDLMKSMQDDAAVIGDYEVTKVTRQTLGEVDLKTAQEFGCTKRVVDKPALMKLVKAGAKIPAEVKTSTFVRIKPVSND